MYGLRREKLMVLLLALTSVGCLGMMFLYRQLDRDVHHQWMYQMDTITVRYHVSEHSGATPSVPENITVVGNITSKNSRSDSPPVPGSKLENINKTGKPSVSKKGRVKKTKRPSQPTYSSLFHEKYGSGFTSSDLNAAIDQLNTTDLESWSYNQTELDKFRHCLISGLWNGSKEYPFYLTKDGISVGSTLQFYMAGGPQKVTDSLWNSLPERPIVQSDKRFKRCSVVGSSGILLGSHCGNEIDKADFVIRFNVAIVRGFETDVGSKTNLSTLNPTYVRNRFGSLKSQANITAFKAMLEQFHGGLLLLPAFGVRAFQSVSFRVAKALGDGSPMIPVYGDPRHFSAARTLWRPILKTGKLPTSGLFMLTSAFEFCEHITLFGFWPFKSSPSQKLVPYHYHDDLKQSTKHVFSAEFGHMLKMHNLGISKLQYSDCS